MIHIQKKSQSGVSQRATRKMNFSVSSGTLNGSNSPWFHSKFKELSNDMSHTQIRVKRRSYGLDKLEKKNWCYVEKMLRQSNFTSRQSKKKMSQQSQKLCLNDDVRTQNADVAT